ncbi:L-azetidine-2-carboxylic acid acetyltransferase [Ceratobasidium theobromae]|uniref:L-azetidine-2-carboxylic acid acetyltransferase n=1 Tax=Ceratobasidium theobromae TaxID=1582974 RepID=A0A5N5QL25_9AGAM|nr:L-azetidine-2-carboxylic acid acetyltransferase [Ceratobasidium theobromae]
MSAYGAIPSPLNRSTGPLKTLVYPLQAKPGYSILVVHLTRESAPSELIKLLHEDFEEELESGKTYPQEGPMGRTAFEAYFFAADVFVGVLVPTAEAGSAENESIEKARAGRDWDESVVGSYYICNAGFVVRPRFRRLGIGKVLGESYVRNAPRLGYKASVFNLVYANNAGSLAIWDRLGFTRAGLIPKAGRLKTDKGEEYFDAVVEIKSVEFAVVGDQEHSTSTQQYSSQADAFPNCILAIDYNCGVPEIQCTLFGNE